jgi:hypothetical protein
MTGTGFRLRVWTAQGPTARKWNSSSRVIRGVRMRSLPCRGHGHQAILSVHRRAPQSTRSCLLLEPHDAANSCRAGRRRLRRDRSRWTARRPAGRVRGATKVVTACPRESSVAPGDRVPRRWPLPDRSCVRGAQGRAPVRSFMRAPTAIFLSSGFWPSRLGTGSLCSHLDSAWPTLLEAAPA